MARNVEIKARVTDPAQLLARIQRLADSGPEVLNQEDVFFHCANGRLKLRTMDTSGGARAELIYYRRDDDAGPKESHYTLLAVADPIATRELLTQAYGVRGVVRKRRQLWLVGPTRVHLDDVEGLGTYLELEVVLAPEVSSDDGMQTATGLMRDLGISSESLVRGAYIDLL